MNNKQIHFRKYKGFKEIVAAVTSVNSIKQFSVMFTFL